MLADKLSQLKKLKASIEQEILNDPILSKYEKLLCLQENNIWGHYCYVLHPFEVWKSENIKQEKVSSIAAGETYSCSVVDESIFNNRDRHEIISFPRYIEGLYEDLEDEPNEKITVLTNRGKYHTITKKTIEEIVDVLFDFCCKHKIVGCELDW